MSETPETPENEAEATPAVAAPVNGSMHFHMILAEVVFETRRGGISSMRTQFMTQSPTETFPADRIYQLQNSAAASILQRLVNSEKVKPANFKVHDVLLLNTLYCGYMTAQEFYNAGGTTEMEVTTVPVAANETPASDNIVPLKPH